MGPKFKKAVNAESDNIAATISQCLVDFFDQNLVNCGCAINVSSMREEINNCKSLIIEQTAVIRLLQNEVDSLKSEIMQVKRLAQEGSNSSNFIGDIRANRRLSGLQINATKTNESNYSASLLNC